MNNAIDGATRHSPRAALSVLSSLQTIPPHCVGTANPSPRCAQPSTWPEEILQPRARTRCCVIANRQPKKARKKERKKTSQEIHSFVCLKSKSPKTFFYVNQLFFPAISPVSVIAATLAAGRLLLERHTPSASLY
ncbi:hypothetical protein IF2G_08488 [Cordyceps javanica]|nr:hypothetical protein IF2G_08488 [Cordyceps javanica]